jgi:hypothetical protein
MSSNLSSICLDLWHAVFFFVEVVNLICNGLLCSNKYARKQIKVVHART